ncbi:DinB family protein [Dokdonia sp. Hel_I_53]|uniref:DinB family protein n=1 Tax=Dokdonia sp. Hel_I_53 TaxID=1566287 RepID=UPI0011997012|nr:DinB family protein [Dokdonia sp. Hel_I_53]TVZ52779.1 DinB family protein [Dokdonia sp. Hel_I_53]
MDYSFQICLKNRQILERFINGHTLEQLNKIPKGFNNNLVWNIGHSIATQQLLTYGLSGVKPQIDMDFINTYKKGTRPEKDVSQDDVNSIHKMLFSTLETLEEDYKMGLFSTFKEYTLSTTGGVLSKVEHAIEFNNFHEGLHLGCCIQLSKLVK